MATQLTITKGAVNDVAVTVNETEVLVSGQQNIVVEVTPVPRQEINIDYGMIGPQGSQGPAGEGVPTGGTIGQALVKTSDSDYVTGWSDTVPNALTADSATLAGNVTGIVAVDHGGTGATTAPDARSSLGAAASGANSDITSMSGVTGGISSPDFVQFDTAITPTVGVGKLQWDPTWGCMQVGMVGGNVNLQIGEETLAYVYNNTGSTITEGQVVKVTGSQGQRLTVALAQANSDANSATILGMATENIPNNSSGFITTQGLVNHISTTGWADGTLLYLSPTTPGAVTSTKPQAPQHLVWIGYVVKGNTSGAGSIYIHTQNGYEIDELHDVKITNPTSGNTLIYDAVQGVWVNANLTAGSGISVTNSAGGITISNTSPSSGGTVTSVATTGTVNGLTLTGGPITSSGTVTLGGALDLSSPPAIGGTTPAAGTFTTLTATGQTSLGGVAGSEGLRVTPLASSTTYINARAGVNGGNAQFGLNGTGSTDFIQYTLGTGAFRFLTNGIGVDQFRIAHTASAVNYVQVTGAATTGVPNISAQGSDANIGLFATAKGYGSIALKGGGGAVLFNAIGTSDASRNYPQVESAVAANTPIFSVQGSSTNIPLLIQSKGTGAIDLAAGSSGVNISNGGTVTAITRTGAGTGYTSPPSVAIAAPTTAGGVQATASAFLQLAVTPTITSGGTGYSVNDVLTFSGGVIGVGSTASAVTVTSVSGGVITGISINQFGTGYSTVPTNPISVTGGTGAGATFTVSGWQVSTFTITNAGSGYVEQPTVSFSGGGGSGAAAYAVVGSQPLVKGLNTINFGTNSGTHLQLLDGGLTNVNFLRVQGGSTVYVGAAGSDTNVSTIFYSRGTGNVSLATNSGAQEQLRVAHTASAVNYVQVTGAATGSRPAISAQGSDTNAGLQIVSKGAGTIRFDTRGGNGIGLIIGDSGSAVNANYIQITGAAASSMPSVAANGSDTNIDLALTPKGTGRVKFGTYTVSAGLVTTGYIEIVDSGGTVRRLAVV